MVSTSTFIISLLLLAFGLWTLLWLLGSFLSPFFPTIARYQRGAGAKHSSSSTTGSFPTPSFRGFRERALFRRRVRVFQEIEQAIRSNELKTAKRLLPKALYLDWIRWSPELIARTTSHHLDLLNKLIIIAELEGRSVRNLPQLESLFSQRTTLLTQAFEARIARTRFRAKQKTKGKTPPQWSTKEFDERITTLEREFDHIRGEIMKSFQASIKELEGTAGSRDNLNQYH